MTRAKNHVYSTEAPYRRIWTSRHYKAKGLSFENFMLIGKMDCHYCGASPIKCNAVSETYEQYEAFNWTTGARKTKGTEKWWNCQWVEINGIDKKEHAEDYNDNNNLLPCCKTCNFLKQRLPYDGFLKQIAAIYMHLLDDCEAVNDH